MNQAVFNHIVYSLRNAEVRRYPYLHFQAFDVFPADFYKELLDSLPSQDQYASGAANYNGRKFATPAAIEGLERLQTPEFCHHIGKIFVEGMRNRFPDGKVNIYTDLRLIRDSENYSIGPHTDAPWKIVSLLFYLPRDDSLLGLGTSVYMPNEPGQVCQGGPHYPFDKFHKVHTAEFRPNSCFGFFKTENSWHGVEPITIPCRRDVLLWNLYDRTMYERIRGPLEQMGS